MQNNPRYEISTPDDNVASLDDYRDSGSPRDTYFGDGGGGGPTVDRETKRYVDKSMDTVKAQNDARFAEVIARLDAMNPATWVQNAGVLLGGIVVTLGLVFGILAYASDRFDSGVSAMGAIEEQLDAQRETNADQNARLDRILGVLEARSDQSETSPEGQD